MVLSIIENSTADKSTVNSNSSKNMNKQLTDHEQLMISEFLDKGEDIAMSTTSVDVDCDDPEEDKDIAFDCEEQYGNNPFCPLAIDETIVQEIIANDDQLKREVDEFMKMYSISMDEDEEIDYSTLDYSTIMGFNE